MDLVSLLWQNWGKKESRKGYYAKTYGLDGRTARWGWRYDKLTVFTGWAKKAGKQYKESNAKAPLAEIGLTTSAQSA
jgi:hypothetical protein